MVTRLTHHFGASGTPSLEALSGFEVLDGLSVETARELYARDRHGLSGLLERGEGPVEVDTHAVRSFANGISVHVVRLGDLKEQLLRVMTSKIKGRGFEHETLEAHDRL